MPPTDMPPDTPPPVHLTGTVCVLSDLRVPDSCVAGAAAGLTVEIGGATTASAASGAFAIDMPFGATEWKISGATVVTSLVPFDPADALRRLPVVRTTDYTALLAANSVVPQATDGAVVVRLVDAGAPVPDATVEIGTNPVLYDGDSATTWDTDVTGALGVAWLPANAPAQQQELLVTVANQAPASKLAHIDSNAITFVTTTP